MTPVLILVVLAVVLGVFGALTKSRSSWAKPGVSGALPETLPVAVKKSFFSRSEQAFFTTLGAVLEGTPYTVFPNVRLNDLFTITDKERRQATYNRLRDKHVDFLIVARDGYAPVLAIELDGASHEREMQRQRDLVKDLVFRSAGLTLLRLDARQPHPAPVLAAQLASRLPGLRSAAQPTQQAGSARPETASAR